jgi:hypothetical protein
VEVNEVQKRCEYGEKMRKCFELVKKTECGCVESEWDCYRKTIERNASEVCGLKRAGGNSRRGSERWNDDIREAIGEKRSPFEEWLQNGDRGTFERFKEKRKIAKRSVKEGKRAADWSWGERLEENFQQNKKMF